MLDLGIPLAVILIFAMLTYFEITEIRRSVVHMRTRYDAIVDEYFSGKPKRRNRVEYTEAPSESDVAIPREDAKTSVHVVAELPPGFTVSALWTVVCCRRCSADFRPEHSASTAVADRLNERRKVGFAWAHKHRETCK